MRRLLVFASLLGLVSLAHAASPFGAGGEREREHPLRYTPDGGDFVIVNGEAFFNRPLYGTNTAFRVDSGDKPEWSLYLPGRGGHLRFGVIRSDGSVRWLRDSLRIETRYRPGALRHTLTDPAFTGGTVQIDSLPFGETEGLIVRLTATGLTQPLTLGIAYGGASGQRGKRDGDIGTESEPISRYFQFKPEHARDNRIALSGGSFTLQNKNATLLGLTFPAATLAVADGAAWEQPFAATASGTPTAPIVTGRLTLTSDAPVFVALQRINSAEATNEELAVYREVRQDSSKTPPVPLAAPYRAEALPALFAAAEAKRLRVQNQVRVDTPDPFLDAAVGALNLAADAVWDEPQGAVMHGAVAWRSKLLGWRGPYSMDALGWHDRARRHLAYWATRQNTSPIPANLPPADEDANLARSEKALHSNGDISNSHYDMNLVYIDALFRHLLWTGDVAFAREVWPVIERHLAWERRLFRREYGPEKLPLYEAYAAIWASDDLQYHGGGSTHASAYNHWHNRMAARVARLIGVDPTPYETEADRIARGLRETLWLPDRGMFAEFKDLLGRQLVHPSAALWSFYHTMDAELVTPDEAWRMTHYVERELPRLPVQGPGVPAGLAMYASTSWMPYTWSINNVVMGENLHTALGFWQAGRPEAAYMLTRSSLLASLFMGICPGNIGSMNYLDAYRGESQRDFGDGSGVFSRALIEGLFGVAPDALAGRLTVTPGFPAEWTHARLHHPDLDFEFQRHDEADTYRLESRLPGAQSLRLVLPQRRENVRVTINGVVVPATRLPDWVHAPRSVVEAPAAPAYTIEVTWSGPALPATAAPADHRPPEVDFTPFVAPPAPAAHATWTTLDLAPVFNDRVTTIFTPGKYRSPRSPYASLAIPAQGIGAWAGFVKATAEIDDTGLRAAIAAGGGRLVLPSGVPFASVGPGDAPNIAFTSQWDNYPREVTVPLTGRARRVHLLLAGSTNWMQSRLDNGEVLATYADGATARLPLHNPTTWWPIEQDYYIDGLAFARPGPVPIRVDLKTARIRAGTTADYQRRDATIPGGAATVLALPLDPTKELRTLTVRTLANEVVIGLLAATLER